MSTGRAPWIVVAPDKSKGSLTAVEAARVIARGPARGCPGAEIVQLPVADGGDDCGRRRGRRAERGQPHWVGGQVPSMPMVTGPAALARWPAGLRAEAGTGPSPGDSPASPPLGGGAPLVSAD